MRSRSWLVGGALIGLGVIVAVIALVVGLQSGPTTSARVPAPDAADRAAAAGSAQSAEPARLPHGRTRVFADNALLIAYYGTAGSGALGVLGENSPQVADKKLRARAATWSGLGRPIQTVYELIVTVADAYPGKDGDYNHDISRAAVRQWIAAAHRNNALVVLDIQPGRSDFLTVAKRWSWALADPWVGLALDPEWRMHGNDVPGRRIGHVSAAEVNRTSAWLARFSAARALPEKVFMLHQFRSDMVRNAGQIRTRPGLALVQHIDGFGTPSQKLATYRHVARPKKFTMGFKLFYDEDVPRMGPRGVGAIRPRVSFVSYQ